VKPVVAPPRQVQVPGFEFVVRQPRLDDDFAGLGRFDYVAERAPPALARCAALAR